MAYGYRRVKPIQEPVTAISQVKYVTHKFREGVFPKKISHFHNNIQCGIIYGGGRSKQFECSPLGKWKDTHHGYYTVIRSSRLDIAIAMYLNLKTYGVGGGHQEDMTTG